MIIDGIRFEVRPKSGVIESLPVKVPVPVELFRTESSSEKEYMRFGFLHTWQAVLFIAQICICSAVNAITNPLPTLADELNPLRQEIGEGTRNLVICIHGWAPFPVNNSYIESDEWAWLVSKIKPVMQANTVDPWALVLYDWHEDAYTGVINFSGDSAGVALPHATQAAINAREHGNTLGPRMPSSLRRVHIIAHSAGAWCARELASDLLMRNQYVVIQVTLLDPFIPEAIAPSGGLLSKNRMQELAFLSGSDRIWLLENYYADDFPAGIVAWPTLGTQEVFTWRPGDMNLQVEWDPDPFHPPKINAYYDWHSGPTLFYGDTIAAADLGIVSSMLPPSGQPYVYQGYGWYNSLFHRTEPQWASLPTIVAQPKNKEVASGAPVTLSVHANSILPLNYQWFKRGQATGIARATGASYTFTASSADAGDYVVRVSDSTGMIFSDFAKVTVTDAPPASTGPSIASVIPSTLTGVPLPQTQLLRIIGSGFTTSSTLLFNGSIASDPARLYFISANEIDYYVRTDTNTASWTVKVINGTQQSNLGYFTVVTPTPNTGSITVNLSPAGAVSAGAQWRVDGGSYRNSGDTVIGLTPGSHTVSFKSVSGYTTPSDKTVSVSNGLNTTTSVSYTVDAPATYTLDISALHGYVAVNPDLNDYPSGTEVRLIANPDDGYLFDSWSGNASGSDPKIYVTMNRDRNITANFKVDTSMGHIRVNISPAQAVAEGAQWKYRYYTEWQNSGGMLDYIPAGTGYVNFKDIPGWITPDQIQATITGGQMTNVNAVYREILGGVQVTLSPYTAGGAGARWRLDGGVWTESGVTLADVSTGSHQIEFLSISGWTAPPSQSVAVERGIIATRTGVYGPPAGMPIITAVSPKTGPISGGTKITIEGVNFQAGATVSFGGIPSTSVTVVSSTKITAVSPPRASYGSVSLSLTTGGQTVAQQNGFSYLNALGSNIELVGQYGGNVEAVAVTGNLVCYGEGPGLVVADISNPAAPVERGRIGLPSIVKGLTIVGNTIFVAASTAGLYAVDISDPTAPSIIGFFDTEGSAWDVAVQENTAYVADGLAGGLQILNVANPMAIVRLGVLDTPNYAKRVVVGTIASKKYAFVAESNGSSSAVRVIDVTTPANPIERTNILAQGYAGITDVKLVGTTLYLSDWERGVKIFNASNPANLVQTGFRDNVGGGAFIDVVGNRLYTCDGLLRIADLAVTPNPSIMGSFDVAPFCNDLVVSNGLAFAAMGRDGLKILNVSNPASISLRSAIQTIGGVEDVWVAGSTAFVGNNDGLFTLDVSNPTRPSRLGALPGERVTDIVVSGETATLVNYGDSQVRIVNVANPAVPILLGTYGSVEAWDVALFGTTPVIACVTDDAVHQPKIDLLNLSTPSNPQSAGSLLLDSGRGTADGIAVAGNWAFVGRPNKALDVISLENRTSPQKVGTVPMAHYMRDVAVSSDANYVYVGDAEAGIQIVDVKTKTTPILSQLIDPPQTPGVGVDSVRVFDNRLFASEADSLFVYDINDPASPQLVGFYDLPGSGYGISVIGDLIFVAGYNAGVSIFRLMDVNKPTVTITGPTINPVWHTNASPISLDGVASDNKAVTRVVWENSLGGCGVATGASTWSVTNLALITGENIITVTAFDQEGNKSSDSISVTYAPILLSQTISFSELTERTYGDPPFTLAATTSSGLPVEFSVVSGPARVTGNVLTLVGAGSVTVRATQAGNSSYAAATPIERTFQVLKANQGIELSVLPEYWLNESPLFINAVASSGLPVIFDILSGPAIVGSNVITLTGAGAVFFRASQPGNSNYNTAPEVVRSFVVAKLPQSITFGSLSRQVVGDAPFELSASASSGLPVSFSVLSGPAIVSGNYLTLTGAGLVVLRASQSGDATNAPAANVDQVLIVVPGNNVITDFQRLPTGMFTFRFYGETGSSYVVEGSTNLVNWSALTTNQVSGLGYLEFADTSATNFSHRYYRVVPVSALSSNSPVLTLTLIGKNVVVSWATNDSGYTLETAASLLSTSWTSNSIRPVILDGRYNITNPISGDSKLYRLRKY